MTAVADAKRSLRPAMLARRREAALADDGTAAERAADRFEAAGLGRAAVVVAGYWPMRGELDPRPLLLRLMRHGAAGALPVATARDAALAFRRWTSEAPLVRGLVGVPEPGPEAEPAEPDLLLVPLLAFDRDGWRLGYGGGYYDRTLAALRRRRAVVAVGMAFAAQETAAVPRGTDDERLDWVVTERGAIRID